jgi:hypothetical protein
MHQEEINRKYIPPRAAAPVRTPGGLKSKVLSTSAGLQLQKAWRRLYWLGCQGSLQAKLTGSNILGLILLPVSLA